MARTGIDNPWRSEDDPDREPEPIEEWIDAGISREEGEIWRRWRFRLQAAMAWRGAAVLDGLRAAQWMTAGATPETVNEWRAAAIDATEAVSWHELGFSVEEARSHKANNLTPEDAFRQRSSPSHATGQASGQATGYVTSAVAHATGAAAYRRMARGPAQKFIEAGVPGQIVQSYLSRQWLDDEAVVWAKEGIDGAEAPIWKGLGLRPHEAGRLVRNGASLVDTVRDWWQANIPISEVADWIGAGLTPEEAATQRANGITAEHAAALRALRDDPTL